MHAMYHVLPLLLASCSASVFHNGALHVTVDTVIHDFQIGEQPPAIPHNFSISASTDLIEADVLCGDSAPDLTGKVAIVRGSPYTRSSKRSSKYANCAERRGAVAIIITAEAVHPGWLARARNFKGPSHVVIPMLEMTNKAADDLIALGGPMSGWSVDLEAGENAWLDMFDSVAWLLGYRVILPICSAFALFRCVACLIGHIMRPPPPSALKDMAPHWVSTRSLVIVILALEIASSFNWLVTGAAGALMSTGNIPYEMHHIFGNAAMACSAGSTLICIALFIRWGSLSSETAGRSTRLEKTLVLSGVYMVVHTVLVGILGACYVFTYLQYMIGSSGTLVIASMVAFVVYAYTGNRFLKRIHENKQSSTSKWAVERRERSLRKFLAWVKMSSLANFLIFAPNMILVIFPAANQNILLGVCLMWVMFMGAVLQSISQSYGLQPDVYADEERRGEAEAARQKYEAKLVAKNRLAALFLPEQELIRKMWGGRSNSDGAKTPGQPRRDSTPAAVVKFPQYSVYRSGVAATEPDVDESEQALVRADQCVV